MSIDDDPINGIPGHGEPMWPYLLILVLPMVVLLGYWLLCGRP